MTLRTAIRLAAVMLLLAPLDAWAKPEVKVSMTAEKEVALVENGQTVIKRVSADMVESGQTIFYTLTVNNDGDEKATNVMLNNPLPEGTVYVADSAHGEGATILFSADGGQVFDAPSRLTVTVDKSDGTQEKRAAGPEYYTHIRWVVGEILPGKAMTLGYQAKVK